MRSRLAILRNRLIFAVAVPLVAACSSATSPSSLAGTYALTSIDGGAMPYEYPPAQGDTTWIRQGSVVLTTSTWSFQVSIDISLAGQHTSATEADSGTYVVSGNTLTMTSSSGGTPTPATASGNTITVTADGLASGGGALTLVFTKQ